MMFSYEEIRLATIDILFGDRSSPASLPINQWVNLRDAVAIKLINPPPGSMGYGLAYNPPRLDAYDAETLREVFWDLFRKGYVTLGVNEDNAGWPFFTVSRAGRKLISEGEPYRFTDTSGYIMMVRRYVPDLDDLTKRYLEEAVQAFYADCMLASNVMLGVATENSFLLLVDAIAADPQHQQTFKAAVEQKLLLRKIEAFHRRLAPLQPTMPSALRENLDTYFSAIQAVVRTVRNESGHPSGKTPSREQTYVHLQMFAPYGQKLLQLRDFFCGNV